MEVKIVCESRVSVVKGMNRRDTINNDRAKYPGLEVCKARSK